MAAHCTLYIICIIAQTFQVGKSSKTKYLFFHVYTVYVSGFCFIKPLSCLKDFLSPLIVGDPGESKELSFFSTLIPAGMEDSQELESALRLMKLNGGYVMIMH